MTNTESTLLPVCGDPEHRHTGCCQRWKGRSATEGRAEQDCGQGCPIHGEGPTDRPRSFVSRVHRPIVGTEDHRRFCVTCQVLWPCDTARADGEAIRAEVVRQSHRHGIIACAHQDVVIAACTELLGAMLAENRLTVSEEVAQRLLHLAAAWPADSERAHVLRVAAQAARGEPVDFAPKACAHRHPDDAGQPCVVCTVDGMIQQGPGAYTAEEKVRAIHPDWSGEQVAAEVALIEGAFHGSPWRQS